MLRLIPAVLLLLIPSLVSAQQPKAELPRVVLVGDSIRLGYAPVVAKQLAGKALVISMADNAGDSTNLLKNLERWVIQERPAVIHFNAGLHDLKHSKKDGSYQVSLEQYEKNLRAIVASLRKETKAVLVFANTTPIHDERHAKRGAAFERTEANVRKYNAVAERVMKELGVPIHDLHGLVQDGGPDKLLTADGTHYTPAGNARLGEAVGDCVLRHLYIQKTSPQKLTQPDPKIGAEYRQKEAERDALVPAAYKNLKFPELKLPADDAAWKEQRPKVHKAVVDSLGDLPQRPNPPKARLVSREIHNGFTLERIALDNGFDGENGALLLIPDKRQKPAPAILWLHSSTPDRNQVLTPHTNGGAEPLGHVFVKAGFVVFAPDAPWYGERAGAGPGGPDETTQAQQQSLLKLHLWLGRTLWGMFVHDDRIALDYLCTRPEVDAKRIGATGMSMGSTRSWWLAAVDERIACTVGVACLTRYENLIKHGQLRQHGVYYFANGLLKHFDSEGVLALIAPRPFLALTGDLDAGSPADGIRVLENKVGRVYQALKAEEKFRNVLYENVGHVYTPEMRREMLAWFERWLRP